MTEKINEVVRKAFPFLIAFAERYHFHDEIGNLRMLAFRFAYFLWTTLLAFADEDDCDFLIDSIDYAIDLYSQIPADPATFGVWLIRFSLEACAYRLVLSLNVNPELRSELEYLDELCCSYGE